MRETLLVFEQRASLKRELSIKFEYFKLFFGHDTQNERRAWLEAFEEALHFAVGQKASAAMPLQFAIFFQNEYI